MAEPTPTPAPAPAQVPADPASDADAQRRWKRDVLIGGGIIFVGMTVAFVVLGKSYYESKYADDVMFAGDDEAVSDAAWAAMQATLFRSFSVFAALGTAAITAALLWPRKVAHALAAGFGVLYFASGVMILTGGRMPTIVGVFQASIGALMLRLTWASWQHKDRAAWAFLLSMSSVLAIAMLFGAPRINHAMGAPGLWFVLAIPFVLVAQAIALYGARRDYA